MYQEELYLPPPAPPEDSKPSCGKEEIDGDEPVEALLREKQALVSQLMAEGISPERIDIEVAKLRFGPRLCRLALAGFDTSGAISPEADEAVSEVPTELRDDNTAQAVNPNNYRDIYRDAACAAANDRLDRL